jgi:hypothetical protein
VADGTQLVDELSMREELRHRPEREPPEVLIETGDDDAHSAVGEGEGGHDDTLAVELGLVDRHDVEALRLPRDLRTGADRTACMRAPAWLTTSLVS